MTPRHLLVGLLYLCPSAAMADASLQDIRIASHPDHIRVVLDLDAAITFTPSGNNSFTLHGLAGGSAVMNAQAKDAPLTRVVLTPNGNDTVLSFETKGTVTAKAFPVSAGGNGGHRFVVDLFKPLPQPTPIIHPSPVSGVVASGAPPAHSSVRGPAVPAVATQSQSTITAVAPPSGASTSDAFAAVAPSNQPEIGPTPYEMPAPQAASIAPPPDVKRPAIANAAPVNTVPFAAANGQPNSSTGAATPAAMHAIVAQADQHIAPPIDRALLAERALDRGDAKAACTAANDALRITPSDLRAMALLGSCQLALGDAVSARATFASALAIDPSYHRARIGLAEADVRQGDLAGARQEYRRVLADNPPTDETYKILDALQALAPLNAVTASAQGT